MMTRPFLIPAKSTIMTLRSAPGLPKKYAVNATSALHYENFSRGPLSAYLHLCSEQDVPDMIGIIEAAGRKPRRTPDDLRQALDGFHMDFPVAHDAGAMASVEDLLTDTDAGKTFTIRTNIGPMPLTPIANRRRSSCSRRSEGHVRRRTASCARSAGSISQDSRSRALADQTGERPMRRRVGTGLWAALSCGRGAVADCQRGMPVGVGWWFVDGDCRHHPAERNHQSYNTRKQRRNFHRRSGERLYRDTENGRWNSLRARLGLQTGFGLDLTYQRRKFFGCHSRVPDQTAKEASIQFSMIGD